MDSYHTPVLVHEAIDGLNIAPRKKYIDATLGGGGHGIEIIKRGGILLGIDQDREAIHYSKENAECRMPNGEWGKEYIFVEGNFRDIEKIAKRNGFDRVSGVLFDLGVSSHQLDTPQRGFSYRFLDAPFDLRMGVSGTTAAEIANSYSENQLYEILATYGEEERARSVAAAFCRARSLKRIETVGDVVSIVQPRDALARVFQAFRIAVNDEFGALKCGLIGAEHLIETGGRLVVISFHSLEDRIVKQYMRQDGWQAITKHPITPTKQEQQINSRSRSAKLRIAQKL